MTTLNSKFVHTNIAIRYLAKTVKEPKVTFREFTINQPKEYIYGKLMEEAPDILGFSVYIWNRRETLELVQMLKTVRPDLTILLGGPEVSFDTEELMTENPGIDGVLLHEGEETFPEVIEHLKKGKTLEGVLGTFYREGEEIRKNPPRPLLKNLDDLPFPYGEEDLEHRILYYETSRGCPFGCEFCLSSTISGLRFLSLSRIKEDLRRLIAYPVRQIKFVDRTFNAREKDAMKIMEFLMEEAPSGMNFHFEVTAHLVSETMLEFLKKAPKGMFQFEVGIQSTHLPTIERIGRTTDLQRLEKVVKRIRSYGTIHQHVDLILGLPFEGKKELKQSFNDTYFLGAEKIQVGFLKLLRGSGLRRDAEELGLVYDPNPPYEILKNPWMDSSTLVNLKYFEDVVERFINEEYLKESNEYLRNQFQEDPFSYFSHLGKYWKNGGYRDRAVSRQELYQVLFEYGISRGVDPEELGEVLSLDYGRNEGKELRLFYKGKSRSCLLEKKERWHDIIREMMDKGIRIDSEEDRVKELVKRSVLLRTPKRRPGTVTLFYRRKGAKPLEFLWKGDNLC